MLFMGETFLNSSAAFSGSFAPASPYKLLEIHKVCLRILSRNPDQNFSLTALAEFRNASPRWGCNHLTNLRSLPGIASSDRFSPNAVSQHLQRRYRSGFTPDYLVQQTQPYAVLATELVFRCRKYSNTVFPPCQQQKKCPRQQKSCATQHKQSCHQPPGTVKPRKLPAWRRYAAPPFWI